MILVSRFANSPKTAVLADAKRGGVAREVDATGLALIVAPKVRQSSVDRATPIAVLPPIVAFSPY